MKEFCPGIFMPRGLLVSQCYFIKNNETYDMIDSGVVFERNSIDMQIKLFQMKPQRIFLTHSHADHAGNAKFFADKYDSEIFCDRNELPYLFHLRSMNRDYSGGSLFTQAIALVDKALGHPKIKKLNIYEEDILSGELYDFISITGHTPGSVAILHRKTRSLFLGDTLLNCHVTKFPAPKGLHLPFECFAENFFEALTSLRELQNLDFENAFFGHGPPIIGGAKKKIVTFLKEKGILSKSYKNLKMKRKKLNFPK